MLKKLIVERFKSIRTATLEFGRVNIFIGGNGAGKSNILEAIGVLSASVDRGELVADESSQVEESDLFAWRSVRQWAVEEVVRRSGLPSGC